MQTFDGDALPKPDAAATRLADLTRPDGSVARRGHPFAPRYKLWRLFQLCVGLYLFVELPYRIAFSLHVDSDAEYAAEHPTKMVIDRVIDMALLAEFVGQFLLARFDEELSTGKHVLVTDAKVLAKMCKLQTFNHCNDLMKPDASLLP